MSFTLIATRSMPIVSCFFRRKASLSLVPDAVRARDHHRVLVLSSRPPKRAPKPPMPPEHLGDAWCACEGLDALDERVAGIDVHARVSVGQGGRFTGESLFQRREILADFASSRLFRCKGAAGGPRHIAASPSTTKRELQMRTFTKGSPLAAASPARWPCPHAGDVSKADADKFVTMCDKDKDGMMSKKGK
jgi:hypothetical protein